MKHPKRHGGMGKIFRVEDTGRYGKGVFATGAIRKGEVIHVFGGTSVGLRSIVERVNSGEERIDDPLQIGMKTYLDLDELSRTFNHSCDPNAALRKRSELFAIRDIPKGSEITYDYSLTIAPTVWSMKCACGAGSCRKTLSDIRGIPRQTLAQYRRLGAMQDYMKKLIRVAERDGAYRMPSYEIESLKKLEKTSR